MDQQGSRRLAGGNGQEPDWGTLYRVAGVAAFLTVALTVVQVVVFILWPPPGVQPAPANVVDWFALLQASWLVGVLDLDALMVLDYVFLLFVYLALGVALWRSAPSLIVLGTGMAMVGIALYFTTNPAVAMLSLSGQYGSAATEADRTACIAAGQAIMATSTGTAFDASYLLMGFAGITVSAAMLRSAVFSRATAIVGILQGSLMLVPSNAGMIGMVFAFASLVPFTVWFVLVGRRLLQLARPAPLPDPFPAA